MSAPVDIPPRKRRRAVALAWAAAGVCLLTLLTLTHVPMKPASPDAALNDTWEHVIAYCGLGGTFMLACLVTWPRRGWLALLVWLGGAVFGGLDELTQPWTGRTCDPRDWRSDLIGLTIALVVVPMALRVASKRGWKLP